MYKIQSNHKDHKDKLTQFVQTLSIQIFEYLYQCDDLNFSLINLLHCNKDIKIMIINIMLKNKWISCDIIESFSKKNQTNIQNIKNLKMDMKNSIIHIYGHLKKMKFSYFFNDQLQKGILPHGLIYQNLVIYTIKKYFHMFYLNL